MNALNCVAGLWHTRSTDSRTVAHIDYALVAKGTRPDLLKAVLLQILILLLRLKLLHPALHDTLVGLYDRAGALHVGSAQA